MSYLPPGAFRIALPPGTRLVNSNDKWTDRVIRTRHIRESAALLAAGIPAQRRVRVRAVYHCPDGRHRDLHNLSLSVKPMIDGLVDAGVIPDDNGDYLTYDGIGRGYPDIAGGQLILIVQGADGYKFQQGMGA